MIIIRDSTFFFYLIFNNIVTHPDEQTCIGRIPMWNYVSNQIVHFPVERLLIYQGKESAMNRIGIIVKYAYADYIYIYIYCAFSEVRCGCKYSRISATGCSILLAGWEREWVSSRSKNMGRLKPISTCYVRGYLQLCTYDIHIE